MQVYAMTILLNQGFLGVLGTRFNYQVPKIRENYHRVHRIREIGSLQVHTRYLTFSLQNTGFTIEDVNLLPNFKFKNFAQRTVQYTVGDSKLDTFCI